jgi:hypothetical protein
VIADLTPRELAARRLLGIAALEKLLAAEKKALREEAALAFTKPGQREVAELPDGTPLGNVRLDKPAAGWRVTDSRAFEQWVRVMHPEHMTTVTVEQVANSYLTAVLDTVEAGEFESVDGDGVVIDCPPGVSYVTAEPRLVVTTDKGAPEAVRAFLGAQAGVLGLREVAA